jgi:hypothetical protein
MTNKTLEQIQEENRKLIILANNPEAENYEKALHMEIKQEGCILESARDIWKEYFSVNFHRVNNYNKNSSGEPLLKQDFIGVDNTRKVDAGYNKILGKPLTLDRILRSLPNYNLFNIITLKNCCKISVLIGINKDKDPKTNPEEEISIYKEMIWDLTKPTLEQQPEETQREINKLLTK